MPPFKTVIWPVTLKLQSSLPLVTRAGLAVPSLGCQAFPGPGIPAGSAPWPLPQTLGSNCWATEQVGERTSVGSGLDRAQGGGDDHSPLFALALSSVLADPLLAYRHPQIPSHNGVSIMFGQKGQWNVCCGGMSPAFLECQPLCCLAEPLFALTAQGRRWGEGGG